LDLREETVLLYEALFFDARPLLKYRAFMQIELRRLDADGPDALSPGFILRAAGYARGAEAVMRLAEGRPDEEDLAWMRGVIRKRIGKNALEAVMCAPRDPKDTITPIKIYLEMERMIAKQSPPAAADPEEGQDHVAGFLNAVGGLFGCPAIHIDQKITQIVSKAKLGGDGGNPPGDVTPAS